MTVAGGLAVYFVIWWTVLFAVLPFGIRNEAESARRMCRAPIRARRSCRA